MDKVRGRDALVGAWRLISWENQAADGQVTYPMGSDPNGYVIYAADGRFSITISQRGRAEFAAGDLLSGTTEEKARAMEGFVAYAGRFSFHGDRVIHQVELSCSPTGRQRPATVGRTSRGSADPQRQPAAAGGQAPSPPPGLGAGRLISEPRLTAYVAGSTDRKVPPGGQEPSLGHHSADSPQPTGRSVAWCSAPDWSTPTPG